MPRLTQVAHQRIQAVVQTGDLVIDTTAGNGHDTLLLAELVGERGKVLALDRQASALEETRKRLQQANLLDRAMLIEGDHADLLSIVPSSWPGKVRAVVFNLGYLPGSDKTIITTADSTCQALNASCRLLHSGGLLSVLIYRGHPGGHVEEAMILNWLSNNDDAFSNIAWNDGDFPTDNSPRLLNVYIK